MSTFSSYPSYKPSGLDWFSEMPSHWELRRLKFIASVTYSNVDKHTKEGEIPVRLCNYVDVYKNDHITNDLEFMQATADSGEIKKFGLQQGDVIVTKDSEEWQDIAVPAFVPENLDGVICGYHLALIRPYPNQIDGGYLFRAFRAPAINYQFQVAASGITRYGLGKQALGDAWIILPPLPEQRAIAAYLDRETAHIDALIAKKRALIDLLEQKRTAIISHAVTKGLNPKARLKPSGVEWLGDVPEGWEVSRLKWLVSKVGSGKTPKGGADNYVPSGVLFIRSQNVHFAGLRLDDVAYITEEKDKEMASSRVKMNDVLLNITGASLGRCALVPEDFPPANVNQHVSIIRTYPRKLSPRFLNYSLMSYAMQSQIFASEDGISREGLNFQSIGNMYVIFPSNMDEQIALSEFLDDEIARIDKLSEQITESIHLLQTQRTALISAAVTGKIDVRCTQG